MKSLVVKEVVTQLNDDGTELTVSTSQYKRNCEYILKKEILMTTCKLSIDKDTFKTEIGGTLSQSSYYFKFDGTDWKYSNNAVDLSDYGITLEGEPQNNDYIYVYADTVNNVVTNAVFTQYQHQLYIGGEEEVCNYINITSSIPTMTFNVSATDYGVGVVQNVNTKVEDFVATYNKVKIVASCSDYYEPTVVTIILAKVIK